MYIPGGRSLASPTRALPMLGLLACLPAAANCKKSQQSIHQVRQHVYYTDTLTGSF